MTDSTPAASVWERSTPRQRLARTLLVLSECTPQGAPTEATLAAVAEGVGSFHGPPMLGSGLPDRPARAREFNMQLRRAAHERFGIEPLIGANAENGLSYSLGRGGTDVPYPAALSDAPASVSYGAGRQIGLDLAACGYDWAFGPVVDVRISRDDPVIGVRTFSGGPGEVAARAVAYLRGVQSTGVLATAKHFPGHGDASVDSHHGVPTVHRDETAHHEIHLRPYRAVIEAGIATIMSAHIVLSDLGLSEVATFSPEIGRDLLRRELGFGGIYVSDSLRMRAVSDRFAGRAAVVHALRAGCDVANIKCAPAAVPALLDELEVALRDGDLDEDVLFPAFERVVAGTRRKLDDTHEVAQGGGGMFDGPGLGEGIQIVDTNDKLPLQPRSGAPIGVLVDDQAVFAEPLESALADLSALLGSELVRVAEGRTPQDGLGALVVISRGQAGPSDDEMALVRAAEGSTLPAAVLLAGPKDVADRCPTRLPTVQAPCIDVFGMVSRSTAYLAFQKLVGPRIDDHDAGAHGH